MDKTIKTERLLIKPYDKTDFLRLSQLLTNEQIKETYMIPDFSSDEALETMVEKLYGLSLSDAHLERGIFLDGELIGFVNDVVRTEDAIEIGYAVHPDYHNRGYATEVLPAVTDALFADGFSTVITGAFAQNTASIRVMEKCGMQKTEKEEDITYRGQTMHCVYYSKSAKERGKKKQTGFEA